MRHPPKGHPPVSALRHTLSTVALASAVVVGALVVAQEATTAATACPAASLTRSGAQSTGIDQTQRRRGLEPHERCLEPRRDHLPDPLRLVVAGMHHGRQRPGRHPARRHPRPVVRRRRRRRPRRRQRGLPAEPHQHRRQLPDHHRLLRLRRGGRLRPERGSRRLGDHPGPRPGRVRPGRLHRERGRDRDERDTRVPGHHPVPVRRVLHGVRRATIGREHRPERDRGQQLHAHRLAGVRAAPAPRPSLLLTDPRVPGPLQDHRHRRRLARVVRHLEVVDGCRLGTSSCATRSSVSTCRPTRPARPRSGRRAAIRTSPWSGRTRSPTPPRGTAPTRCHPVSR